MTTLVKRMSMSPRKSGVDSQPLTKEELRFELTAFCEGEMDEKLKEVLDQLDEKLDGKLQQWASVLVFEVAREIHQIPGVARAQARGAARPVNENFASLRFGQFAKTDVTRNSHLSKASAVAGHGLSGSHLPKSPYCSESALTSADASGLNRISEGNEDLWPGVPLQQQDTEPSSRNSSRRLKNNPDVDLSARVDSRSLKIDKDGYQALIPVSGVAKEPGPSWTETVVTGDLFERIMGVLVLLNGLLLGLDASYGAEHPGSDPPWWMKFADLLFCAVFTCELSLRLRLFGWAFFTGENRTWNILDVILVALQVMEHVVELLGDVAVHTGSLRMLRLLRIARLLRVLHLFDELQAIVLAVNARSFKSLLWSTALLIMVVYMFSVFFLSMVNSANSLADDVRSYWFGNLGRTMLTMFEVICGGVSWDEVAWPLARDMSGVTAVLFCGYVAIGSLALLNLITGIWVDVIIEAAHDDRDHNTINHITRLFLAEHDAQDEINSDEFARKMEDSALQAYFASLDVRPSEAPKLFQLLDVDGSGTVSADEIISGCLTMRGTAKGLDVCVLLRELCSLKSDVLSLQEVMVELTEAMTQDKEADKQQAEVRAPTFRRISMSADLASSPENVRAESFDKHRVSRERWSVEHNERNVSADERDWQ